MARVATLRKHGRGDPARPHPASVDELQVRWRIQYQVSPARSCCGLKPSATARRCGETGRDQRRLAESVFRSAARRRRRRVRWQRGVDPPAPPPAPLRRSSWEPEPHQDSGRATGTPPCRFAAASLFGFDQQSIKPEGKAALEHSSAQRAARPSSHTWKGTRPSRIFCLQRALSRQRADAVRGYLVESVLSKPQGHAVGKGETDLHCRGACSGTRPTPALIACLQPDRRVEVEVSGTR